MALSRSRGGILKYFLVVGAIITMANVTVFWQLRSEGKTGGAVGKVVIKDPAHPNYKETEAVIAASSVGAAPNGDGEDKPLVDDAQPNDEEPPTEQPHLEKAIHHESHRRAGGGVGAHGHRKPHKGKEVHNKHHKHEHAEERKVEEKHEASDADHTAHQNPQHHHKKGHQEHVGGEGKPQHHHQKHHGETSGSTDKAAAVDADHHPHHKVVHHHHQKKHGADLGASSDSDANHHAPTAAAGSGSAAQEDHHHPHGKHHKKHHGHEHRAVAEQAVAHHEGASDSSHHEGSKAQEGLLEPVTPAPTKKSKRAKLFEKRRAFGTESHEKMVFANMSFIEALEMYEGFMKTPPSERLEQSSAHFKDIREKANFGIRLPTTKSLLSALAVYEKGEGPMEDSEAKSDAASAGSGGDAKSEEESSTAIYATDCDASDADYTLERDEKCQQYMRDPLNWLSVKPMSSILNTGRTIKFKVFFKQGNLSAVMKVSQKKFALEPASEVMAFHTDRLLKLFRVPPTVWVPFPVSFLKAGCATMDAFYSHWFQKFSLDYETTKELQRAANPLMYDLKTMNVSLQIWMNDVHDADETILNPPSDYAKYLTVHSGVGDGASPTSDVDWATQPTIRNITIRELVNEFLFDYIIDNTDRWFGHNSFAVGGCLGAGDDLNKTAEERQAYYGTAKSRCLPPAQQWKRSKIAPRFAFIDQGSSFYRRSPPDANPFTKKDSSQNLCRFSRAVTQAILGFIDSTGKNTFSTVMKKQLPSGIFNLASKTLLKASGKRLEDLAAHIKSCIERYGEPNVLFFE